MHGMSGALCNYESLNATACESEVADQIEHLVTDVFVAETQRPVLRTIWPQHDRVLLVCSANQTHVAQFLFVRLVAESASWRDERAISLSREIDACLLPPDGSREVDSVLDPIARTRDIPR